MRRTTKMKAIILTPSSMIIGKKFSMNYLSKSNYIAKFGKLTELLNLEETPEIAKEIFEIKTELIKIIMKSSQITIVTTLLAGGITYGTLEIINRVQLKEDMAIGRSPFKVSNH